MMVVHLAVFGLASPVFWLSTQSARQRYDRRVLIGTSSSSMAACRVPSHHLDVL